MRQRRQPLGLRRRPSRRFRLPQSVRARSSSTFPPVDGHFSFACRSPTCPRRSNCFAPMQAAARCALDFAPGLPDAEPPRCSIFEAVFNPKVRIDVPQMRASFPILTHGATFLPGPFLPLYLGDFLLSSFGQQGTCLPFSYCAELTAQASFGSRPADITPVCLLL